MQDFDLSNTLPVLAIVGPTASGKSSVAMQLAETKPIEIVSCDSVQVYREFDIGCAKPSKRDQKSVPHHLIDVVSWNEGFDAAKYCVLADKSIQSVLQRSRIPLVCGGTGLYLRALRYGLIGAPPADPVLREQLLRREKVNPGFLLSKLSALDPACAANIDTANQVRVLRALEICMQTGKKASDLRTRHGFSNPRMNMRVFVLNWETKELKQRIEKRTTWMINHGLVEEVESLLAKGIQPNCRPMRSLGYKETCQMLAGSIQVSALQPMIVQHTWAYARRQRTWFRREQDVTFVDMESVDQIAREIKQQFDKTIAETPMRDSTTNQ